MIVRKTFIICDKCGERIEIPADMQLPFSCFNQEGSPWERWHKVDESHCLCPDCAAVYKARKAEVDRELREMAGIRSFEIEI